MGTNFDYTARQSSGLSTQRSDKSYLLARFSQYNINVELLLATINSDLHCISGTVVIHDLTKVLLVLNIFTVNGHNQIAAQHDRHVAQIRALTASA